MMTPYLTKTLFKLALGCPTKLSYTNKKIFADTRLENDFLMALTEGGFQVGELAKIMFPGGIEITDRDQQTQLAKTRELLTQGNVTLFEATIQTSTFLARIDILKKSGDSVDLIEVKSKSYDSLAGLEIFRKKRDKAITREMLPYLQDVAFQTMIFRLAFPGLTVHSFLMMPDKAKTATIDGLNQKFRIYHHNGRTSSASIPGTTLATVGEPLLTLVNVDEFVDEILAQPLDAPGAAGFFLDIAARWGESFARGQAIPPVIGAHCAKCEFRNPNFPSGLRSGFHECWKQVLKWEDQDFTAGTVLELFNSRKKQTFIDKAQYKLSDLSEVDLQIKEGQDGLTTSQRQLMQVTGEWLGGEDFYLDRIRMKSEMHSWSYPLNFIDFEACQPALPFTAGKQPYSRVAFQFSHHIMERDGSVRHANEFIDVTPGYDPSYDFLNHLKGALGTQGTVFMWSPYENTVLNKLLENIIADELKGRGPANSRELKEFIKSLTVPTGGKDLVHTGERNMVDLAKIAGKLFFHPDTKGRSSIKVVLPAVLKSSAWLKNRYSQPVYGSPAGIPSRNFQDFVWWQLDPATCAPKSPYELLQPIFSDLSQAELDALDEDEGTEIREGGAATTAYARLQFSDVDSTVREATRKGLLRYCELDTLAMVMVVEAWREWLD